MGKNNGKTALFIHHGASIGGAPICLLEILKRIDKTKCKIIVILPEEGPFSDLLKKEGIEYRVIPLFIFYYCSQYKTAFSIKNLLILFSQALGNILFLPRILRKENSEVVIINTSTPLLCGIIAKVMGKRVIWHIREVLSTEKSRALKKIIAAIIRFSAEKVVVVSQFSLRDMENLEVNNTSVVYDGAVDLQKFCQRSVSNEEFQKFGLNPNDKIVGFVGQIYKEKGWQNLVKAAFLIVQKLPYIKFLIVGSGHMIEREGVKYLERRWYNFDKMLLHLIQIVKEMGLGDNFVFLGQRFDVENILPLMDCLVFPSIVPETFGRVMTEAMACGLPVVASNIGGASEIVVNNITGLLVEPNNPKVLANTLIDILTNEEKAKDMGDAGRKRAEELFDIEKVVPELLQIYKI